MNLAGPLGIALVRRGWGFRNGALFPKAREKLKMLESGLFNKGVLGPMAWEGSPGRWEIPDLATRKPGFQKHLRPDFFGLLGSWSVKERH